MRPIRQHWYRALRLLLKILPLFLVLFGLTIFISVQAPVGWAQLSDQNYPGVVNPSKKRTETRPESVLPIPRIHPLPQSLAGWQDPKQSGDYFDQIKQTIVGYLVWSHFPITVYIQPLTAADSANPFTSQRSQDWVNAVAQAAQEWNQYLSLEVVSQPEGADIAVLRSSPPLRLETDPEQPNHQSTGAVRERRPILALGRARSAETRFELYARSSAQKSSLSDQSTLGHRFTIFLRPGQAPSYLQAAARHELGHALGIWGHSPNQTDALYFSQVRNPPPISPRDLNTLKRIYSQPTSLGWELPVR